MARSPTLTRDPAGLPAALVAEHPELKGAVALRLDKKTAQQLTEILKGQVAVAMYDCDRQAARRDGAQIAIVARQPVCRKAGSVLLRRQLHRWQGRLQPVGADRAVGRAADVAGRLGRPARERCQADADDAAPPTARGRRRGASLAKQRALPLRGEGLRAEHRQGRDQLVTDPNSVALTLNSTRSVAVDLDDTAYMPSAVAHGEGAGARARTSTRRSTSCTSATTR